MPSSTLDTLVERYTEVSLTNQRMLASFSAVARSSHDAHLPMIVLKGGDLIPRLYGIAGLRPLSDIDLLVRHEDLPRIHNLLLGMGFVPQLDGNPSYRLPGDPLSLDIVTAIWYLDDQEGLWARRTRRPLAGVEVAGLGTTDLVLHLIAYSVVHRGHLSETFRADLALLLAREQPDWPMLLAQAAQSGLRMPLAYALKVADTSIPSACCPHWVHEHLHPTGLGERLDRWILRRLVTREPMPDLGFFLLFWFAPWSRRLRQLQRFFLPESTFLSWRYGTTAAAAPWRIRVQRWGHLIVEGSRLLGGILSRLISTRQAA